MHFALANAGNSTNFIEKEFVFLKKELRVKELDTPYLMFGYILKATGSDRKEKNHSD